ncbi:uncharacterized protein J3D65DRAFT_303392 [Phyllosticta citribraziliensis]|uniref:Uncharacterized protein n=1 Tax=Phyllosticta citribraziliensis TaxID=989973 RepID=A0ABR1M0W4_9PEZI
MASPARSVAYTCVLCVSDRFREGESQMMEKGKERALRRELCSHDRTVRFGTHASHGFEFSIMCALWSRGDGGEAAYLSKRNVQTDGMPNPFLYCVVVVNRARICFAARRAGEISAFLCNNTKQQAAPVGFARLDNQGSVGCSGDDGFVQTDLQMGAATLSPAGQVVAENGVGPACSGVERARLDVLRVSRLQLGTLRWIEERCAGSDMGLASTAGQASRSDH